MMFVPPQSIHSQRGFSLIELMVTISIVVIVTGIALVRYTSFNSALLLTNQTYEIALDLRQAQVLGVSVSASEVAQDGNRNPNRNPIGIAFSTTETNAPAQPSATSYVLFSDYINIGTGEGDDGIYTTSGSTADSPLETFGLDARFLITELRAGDGGSMSSCDELFVTYKRPDFDARIVCQTASGSTEAARGEITVTGVTDQTVTNRVVVWDNGQISVQQ